jgi:hypothetical protein
MKNINTDVLIYIEKLREYINNSDKVKKYFIGDNDEEQFYNMVLNVAIVNQYKRNEPNLNEVQFEFIKMTLESFKDSENFENYIFTYIPKNIKFYFK